MQLGELLAREQRARHMGLSQVSGVFFFVVLSSFPFFVLLFVVDRSVDRGGTGRNGGISFLGQHARLATAVLRQLGLCLFRGASPKGPKGPKGLSFSRQSRGLWIRHTFWHPATLSFSRKAAGSIQPHQEKKRPHA